MLCFLRAVNVKLQLRDGRTDRRTDFPSVCLSRVAATSTQRDGCDRRGRCCRACLSVRPSVRFKLHLRDGRPSVRPSLRWSLTLIIYKLTYMVGAAARPPSRLFSIPDGWNEIATDIRLSRIIEISKIRQNLAEC